jgi:TolB protein
MPARNALKDGTMWMMRLFALLIALGLATLPFDAGLHFAMRLVAVDEAGGGDATIAPDGGRFVATSRRTGDWELWIYDIDARRWQQVTHAPGEDFEAKWSPDGTQLVFTTSRAGQKDIWTVNLKTGAERQLVAAPDDDEYPAWSPDGRWIVYTGGPWNSRDIFVVPASGGRPRRVTRASGRAGACTFEPGGETLICHRYDNGTGDLERVWVRDGETVPLTAGPAWDYKPTTSPDGRFIAFSRSVEGPSHIWMMPAAGGRPWRVTSATGEDRWPTWSGDSRRILFHRAVDESLGVESISRGDTGASMVIPANERPFQATRDAGGSRIAFCAGTATGRRVRVRDAPGRPARDVDTGGRESCFPRWSPDGKRLALVVRNGERWDVAVVSPDGHDLKILTRGHTELRGMDGPVDWSPDAKRIVFHADTEPFEARLFVVDATTAAITPITSAGFFDESPSWTPDGGGVLFMSTRGGNWTWGLFRLDLASGAIKPFVAPDWSEKNFPREAADGVRVWIGTDEDGVDRLMERPRSGAPHAVAGAAPGARWPEPSANGNTMLYTRMAHHVEFWVIDNPVGAGTPSWSQMDSTTTAESRAVADAANRASPRAFNRR